ncbi:MAG: hypothetical protein JOY54_20660 [Acidobacteriaceae bacterium]|nr:hypothetical protein [Acidobacteriaceae bacterium]
MRPIFRYTAVALLVGLSFQHSTAAQRSPQLANSSELPPSAEEVASATGILPLLQRLQEITLLTPASINPWEVLSLRQEIVEDVLSSSLQVDATIAQIDNEIAQAGELRGYLADKRDRAINMLNLSSLAIGGTLGIVSSALQLSTNLARAGNATGIVSGTVTSTLSAIGLKEQKGKERQFTFPSKMLAKLFNRPADTNSEYPPAVWEFITSVAPTDPDKITRQERLIRTWVQVKRIDSPDTPSGKVKIEHVTSRPSDNYKLTIDDLEDRGAMLQDLRAKLSLMKRDLGLLLQALPKMPSGSFPR